MEKVEKDIERKKKKRRRKDDNIKEENVRRQVNGRQAAKRT